MQSILKELFYGNINPNAKQSVRNSEHGKAVKTVSDCEEKLNALLSGKELELPSEKSGSKIGISCCAIACRSCQVFCANSKSSFIPIH